MVWVSEELPLCKVLQKEMQAFSVKITTAGNESFEAWREKDHDDIVLAVALGVWLGERGFPFRPPSSIPHPKRPVLPSDRKKAFGSRFNQRGMYSTSG